ncbi:hypothetical protein TNCV_3632331 [Trichonephila clavipes]|nr:hypothetical protein TNCV_3632331 [Trichonephila clavipes]
MCLCKIQRGGPNVLRYATDQESPNANNICKLHQMFQETGCLCKGKSRGRTRVSVENVERIRIFQQDGAPPHWGTEVHTFLNQHLPKRWIGRSRDADDVFCS